MSLQSFAWFQKLNVKNLSTLEQYYFVREKNSSALDISLRLKAFSAETDIDLIEEYLKAWELICSGDPDGGAIGEFELADRFRWLASAKSTMLQCSKTHPGLCYDPEHELDDLFEKYVR